MGLAERRAAKEFETNQFPALKAKVVAAAGYDVPMEIDWESLSAPEYAHLYAEAWPKVYFETLAQGFSNITVDQMGKDALKAALKKIIIKNTDSHYSAPGCYKFENGVLTFDHQPCSNVDDIKDRARELQKMLEAKL